MEDFGGCDVEVFDECCHFIDVTDRIIDVQAMVCGGKNMQSKCSNIYGLLFYCAIDLNHLVIIG